MRQLDYLQEWHGFYCVDAGEVEGRAAMPLADHIEAETGWRSAWPLPESGADLPENVQAVLAQQGFAHQSSAVSYATQLQWPDKPWTNDCMARMWHDPHDTDDSGHWCERAHASGAARAIWACGGDPDVPG